MQALGSWAPPGRANRSKDIMSEPEMSREGIPLPVIQRQLGHAHLGITSIYLQGRSPN
jgi:integrase